MSKFYITTPIYYVNDKPHIGHAYATIAADALARYWRMLGEEVLFLTGTDENSQKNIEAAAKTGEDQYDYVDRMAAIWQRTWDELGITNNDFIRTTEARHHAAVNKFWQAVSERGDMYKGSYEGLYCVGCEAYYTETDLTADGLCPIHQRPVEKLAEQNYFFKLSNYREALLAHIEAHPDFVQPETRRNEIINYIKDHLQDISISRPNKGWGISVPGDETQAIYVWFDALINYLTAAGYGSNDGQFVKWWPASLHLVGKDIIKFHCALWPAMLMSAGLALPERVFAHGFFTINGQKVSKSLGNAIDPNDLVATYGLDALRYFLLREISFGGDGDFSIERISARYDADLASGLGNLASRITTLAAGRELTAPTKDGFLAAAAGETRQAYEAALADIRPDQALEHIWKFLTACDKYIDQEKPWVLVKDPEQFAHAAEVFGTLVEALRQIAWLLVPLLPTASGHIFAALGCSDELQRPAQEAMVWGAQIHPPVVQKITPLFPRLTA